MKSTDTPIISTDDDRFSEIGRILESIKIELPESEREEGDSGQRTVLSMFRSNRMLFVKGLSVGASPSDLPRWFEKEVIPFLVVHRLVTVDRLTGQSRYSLTEKGLDFMAWVDRRIHLRKTEKTSVD